MFKAKGIKDGLMLTYSQINQVERSTETVLKHVDAMNKTWSDMQKHKKKEKLLKNLERKLRANDFVDQLLVKCKEHGAFSHLFKR